MVEIGLYTSGGGSTNGYLMRYITRIKHKIKEIAPNILITPDIGFDFVVRIDGVFFAFGDPAGCSHLKLFKERGFIAITIAITDNESALPTRELLEFFKTCILSGFSQMFDRLLKEKYILNKDDLMATIKIAIDSIPQEINEENLYNEAL